VTEAEGNGPVERLHNLLLALTGRVDDDAINSARELLGSGRADTAAEYLTGCLLAGQLPVSAEEQHQLQEVLRETRSSAELADGLNVVESVPEEPHRFASQDISDDEVLQALENVSGRLHGVRNVWCAWRTTPAGASYGAVPQRVLLAEVDSGGSVSAVGYQLITALRRAGVSCAVDVFSSGAELPSYHQNALAAAHQLPLRLSTGQGVAEPAPAVPAAVEPEADPEPVPEPEPEPEPVSRPEAVAPVETADTAEETGVPESTDEETAAPAADEPVATSSQAAQPEPAKEDAENKSMRVPPAVDAKLTDRERNLLRKLHEELAQREQDRSGARRQRPARPAQDPRTSTMPGGTGGFPPIGVSSVNQPGYPGQSN
jgi:hypothetical protein